MLSFGTEKVHHKGDSDFLLYLISFYVLRAFFPIRSIFSKEYSDFYGVTWRRAGRVSINVTLITGWCNAVLIKLLESYCC